MCSCVVLVPCPRRLCLQPAHSLLFSLPLIHHHHHDQELPPADAEDLFGDMIFEQDPIQILNAILPLYINGQVLRMLQESVASELGARMAAMQSASDNAEELADKLTITYNRARQVGWDGLLPCIVCGSCGSDVWA